MAKKQKSKTRLDKYYYLAKDHGFRSRATFKLIQLNKKYNFFSNANVCVDLCAAPGGWLQAASKFMPISSVKIGIDLDPIKPIPGCTTFVSDITTQDCRNKLEKELKNLKADVFLNDGAPNVGGNWNFDAYTQSELVLHALKLASEFLKPGGTFVTKVFRSSDYSSLIYVMNQLFKKVEATKPLASRQVSAEIFVVCRGFKNADIDSKFLDPKYALKQLDADEDTKASNIKSIKALLETSTNRHRSGYYGDLYKSSELSDFIETINPYQFFYENTKITINSERSKEYMNSTKPPKDFDNIISDLKVLGKTELKTLLLWREKIRTKSQKLLKQIKNKANEEKDNEKDKETSSEVKNTHEYKKEKFDAIDLELDKLEKARKKKLKSKERKREQVELKQKISFLKDNNNFFINESNDFDPNVFKYLKDNNINIEDVAYNNEESEEEEEEIEEENESFIDDEDYYNKMNNNIENQIKLQQENKDILDMKRNQKKKNKKEKREFGKIEEEVSDLDDNDIVKEKEDSENEGEDESEEEKTKTKTKTKKETDSDSELSNFSENYSDHYLDDEESSEQNNEHNEEEDKVMNKKDKSNDVKVNKKNENVKLKDKKNTFLNPLSKMKFLHEEQNSKNDNFQDSKFNKEEENESSDTDNENMNKKMLSKKRKNPKDNKKEKKDIEDNEIEFVPRKNEFEDNLDLDEIAEIRAIAKKMLRKKDRINIIENTYNRYSFKDFDNAPDWFKEDEVRHNKKTLPVTKEEVEAEKEYLREINSRTPKKILEAKNRKKKKMLKAMDKLKKKAQTIVNQDDMGEVSKIREIEKLYKKEMIKNQPKKKYVIARANQKVAGKNSKSLKFVDKRLKKDKRSLKRAERRNKGSKQEKMKKINHMKKQKKVVKFRKR